MLYWYTGQPGHGKTLNAIDRALRMKEEADAKHKADPQKYPHRPLYVCNVRDFDYAKTGAFEMTPEMFRAWADSPEYLSKRAAIDAQRVDGDITEKEHAKLLAALESEKCATEECDPRFTNAIMLIDEAYEHQMLPKRPPSSALPRHVERIAKHRHHGLDIIGVCQSPDTQCDAFVRDLIEEHVHVRRLFGTNRVQLRIFDKFEAQAEKRTPLRSKIIHLTKGKKSVGTYKSTVFDTTERRIPWYYYAAGIGAPLGLAFILYVFMGLGDRLGGGSPETPSTPAVTSASGAQAANGAHATVAAARAAAPQTAEEYAARFTPRIAAQPWSAPAYDSLTVPAQPPRVFCMISGAGEDASGLRSEGGCTCITDQGTRYAMPRTSCEIVATQGQYEPFRQNRLGDDYRMDGQQLQQRHYEDAQRIYAQRSQPAPPGGTWTMPTYGDFGQQTGNYVGQGVGP